MSKEKVVGIYGGIVIVPEPHEGVIEALEELLEMARSGEVVGFYGAITHGDEASSTYAIGHRNYATLGALTTMQAKMALGDI